VVGSGGIAAPHLWSWRRLGLDVLLFSTNPNVAEVAAGHGAAAVPSLAELLDRADVVDVCTPTPSHPGIAAAAAAAGRPIVCEKPLARTAVEARAMVTSCAEAGVALYPAHVVRYFPEYAAAQRSVVAGDIGTPTRLILSRRSAAPDRAWFADPARSGGVVLDQLIHDLDYARWVAGEVVTVRARIVNGRRAPEQRASVQLIHAGGAVSELTGEWGGPEVAFAASFTVVGTTGEIGSAPAGAGTPSVLPRWQTDDSPYLAQAAEFLAALRGGPKPRVSAADGVAAVAIAEAALRAAELGQPVDP
jgi:myo-inositol 2-dehydrogenase/D-chiro-inositol 1-dehydrogenase